ncbi:CaiB/BaiF CoA-transferase family protein [Dermacoccus sp. PAMC28757]|uniref:CaiB/BaiF CoA transferase family protein n=1 Tax=Dermacoccus sp. PAMC28757 TaxID=2762331 RepID=UPI0021047223|nr:CoA transferase [Dermacoccus sp. PAMC28757]
MSRRADVPNAPGALDGLLIADFGRVLAGPYATMLLADLGADVVKIERPTGGDDTRSWGPPFTDDGEATYFLSVNRNKRSEFWDLRDDDDLAAARDLVTRADVVVENFLPGTMDRLGLGYDDVVALNPDIVYVSITGFGDSALPGCDLLVQAVGGLMSVTGTPEAPTKVGVAMVDVVTGLHAAVGMLAALRHRDATGEGQRVEVSLLSSLLSALVNQSGAHVMTGAVPRGMGNRHPSLAPYEIFATAGRPLAIAVGNNTQFAALSATLEHPEWASDPRFATNAARVEHRDELFALLERALAGADAETWAARLADARVPAGPVNDLAQAFDLADEVGLPMRVDVDGLAQVANPIRMSATPATYRSRPPRMRPGPGGREQ